MNVISLVLSSTFIDVDTTGRRTSRIWLKYPMHFRNDPSVALPVQMADGIGLLRQRRLPPSFHFSHRFAKSMNAVLILQHRFTWFQHPALSGSTSLPLNDDNWWGNVVLLMRYYNYQNIRKLLISSIFECFRTVLHISPSRVVACILHLNKKFISSNYHCFLDFWTQGE